MNTNIQRKTLKDSSGFTFIELMISMVLGFLVIAVLYKAYIFQDDVIGGAGRKVDAVQNARNTIDILTRDLRTVGTGVPEIVDDVITVAKYQTITYLANSWNISTRLSSQAVNGATSLTVENSAGFIVGQNIYVCSDAGASGPITLAVAPPNGTTITLPAGITGNYPTGCLVNVVDTVTYEFAGAPKQVRRTILPANALNVGTVETLADNIDYLQFLFFDAGGNQISSIGSTLSQAERRLVRRLELTVVAVPNKEDSDKKKVTVTYDDGTTKTDGYRRITLETDIKLRNMY